MNKPDYPVELESQIIMRLPEEPARALREALTSGENFKNRLSIQIDNDMRRGEVRFDHWLLHAKIVDLPTIVESLKTIDRKSLYKTADICQMMICKNELEPISAEEESPKNKKKDSFKVDKKFLWPHGITPPTKNVRKRRFRKTLKKKSAEAPEIEKEVKRLLRADNEAVSITWEVIKEEEEQPIKPESGTGKLEKKMKKEHGIKNELVTQQASKVEDIFGGALSDSDLDEENINVDIDSHLSYDDHLSDSSVLGPAELKNNQFSSDMFNFNQGEPSTSKERSHSLIKSNEMFDTPVFQQAKDKNNILLKLHQLSTEIEELKQRRQRTQIEISGMENMALKQRFQDTLQNLNKDIINKEKKYQNLQALMNFN